MMGTQTAAKAMDDFIDSTDHLDAEVFTGGDETVPGLRWSLSEDAQQALRDIDDNIRAAEQISGQLTVG